MVDLAFVLKKILTSVILPPMSPILLALIGMWLLNRHHRLGRVLISLSLVITAALSTHLVGGTLLRSLQDSPPLNLTQKIDAQAIVILAGGMRHNAAEFGGRDDLNAFTLERLRYGAWLAKRTDLPVMVAGGGYYTQGLREADVMAVALQEDYSLAPRWIERTSLDTAENATQAAVILRAQGVSRVILVTHAWHMKRARREFESAGFTVTSGPANFVGRGAVGFTSYVPNAKSYLDSALALHEWTGILWARLRGR